MSLVSCDVYLQHLSRFIKDDSDRYTIPRIVRFLSDLFNPLK